MATRKLIVKKAAKKAPSKALKKAPPKKAAKKAPLVPRPTPKRPPAVSKDKQEQAEELQRLTSNYGQEYSDESFWAKVKGYAKAAGGAVLNPAMVMYYAGMDAATPLWARTTITGALGYFISPIDAIPDFTPVLGYSDDLGVLTAALAVVAAHIKPAHKQRAREKLREWFD